MSALLTVLGKAAHHKHLCVGCLVPRQKGDPCASIGRDFSRTLLITGLSKIGQSMAALGKTIDLLSF